MVDGCDSISNSLSIYGYNSNENLTPKLFPSTPSNSQQQFVNTLGTPSNKYSCEQHTHSSYSEESDPDHFVVTTDDSSFSYSAASSVISIGACGSSNEHFEESYTGEDDEKIHHDDKFRRLSVTSLPSNKVININNPSHVDGAATVVTPSSCKNDSLGICDGHNCQLESETRDETPSPNVDEKSIDLTTKNPVRIPLNRVVTSLVNRWSLDYVREAEDGNGEAMCLVAQMCLDKNGWGCVQHNECKGRYWLEKARSKGYSGAVNQLAEFYGIPAPSAKGIPKVSTASNQTISLSH